MEELMKRRRRIPLAEERNNPVRVAWAAVLKGTGEEEVEREKEVAERYLEAVISTESVSEWKLSVQKRRTSLG